MSRNFRDAFAQLRFHPARLIATLIAITISIGFMAAVSVFIRTQSDVLAKESTIYASKADVVAKIDWPAKHVEPTDVVAALNSLDSVGTFDVVARYTESVTTKDGDDHLIDTTSLVAEPFRWAKLTTGEWPGQGQIALPKDVAKQLGVTVGDTLFTYGEKLTVSGLTNDPSALLRPTGMVAKADDIEILRGGVIVIKTADGYSPQQCADQVSKALKQFLSPDAEPTSDLLAQTSADRRAEATQNFTGNFDSMRNALLVFASIALVVGMIIIANTFTILLTQRRRQIGLLRCVGATTSQIRARYLTEALFLGALGSSGGIVLGLGAAAGGTAFASTLVFGLTIPWGELAIEWVVGVLITVAAAMIPIMRTSRVKPLEALRPITTEKEAKRATTMRVVSCSLLAIIGVVGIIVSFLIPSLALPAAVLGSALLTLGVLFGAPLYIPAVIRLLGAPFRGRPVGNLAVENTLRNPGRASATATALMLAIGLIITLQVGAASIRSTISDEINVRMPIDLSVTSDFGYDENGEETGIQPLPDALLHTLDGLPGVAHKAELSGVKAKADNDKGESRNVLVTAWSPQAHEAARNSPPETIPDDVALVPMVLGDQKSVTLTGESGSVTLRVEKSYYPQTYRQVIVSPTTLDKLGGEPRVTSVWLHLVDLEDTAATLNQLLETASSYDQQVAISGAAPESMIFFKVLDAMVLIVTALLAVAVLIALVGVSNTLTLSVIERKRESALLRALGMQRGSLRAMLTIEALLLSLAGLIVGLIFGAFFGWVGISALISQMNTEMDVQLISKTHFSLDVGLTLAMIAATIIAGTLASILPGHQAATAPPTEALAEE